MKTISRAPWVASRTYMIGTDEARSAISNEKGHEFLVLEKESSELWSLIEVGVLEDDLIKHAEHLGVSDELPSFLTNLIEADLIVDNEKPFLNMPALSPPVPQSLEMANNTDAEYEMMQWVADRGYLWAAFWEMTYRCNERCVHCFNPGAAHSHDEKASRETNELTTDEGRKLLDELAGLGVLRLTLSGGEVLLRHDFLDLLAHARKLGMSVSFYTNGLLLSPSALDQISALWPDSVGVSVYSSNPETHDAITGVPKSFSRSVMALRLLHDRGIKTYLKSAQMKHSVDGYKNVQELAEKVGAAAEIELQVVPANDGAQEPLALMVQDPGQLIVLAATPGSPLYVGTEDTQYGYVVKKPEQTVCGAGVGLMSIDPSGGISPCPSLPLSLGSFKNIGIREIWHRSLVGRKRANSPDTHPEHSNLNGVEILSAWQQVHLGDFHECGTHERCGWCSKCPGAALVETGDVLAPSTVNCRLATAKMFAAKLLKSGRSLGQIRELLKVSAEFGHESKPKALPLISLPVLRREDINIHESGIKSLAKLCMASTSNNTCSGCSNSDSQKTASPVKLVSFSRDNTTLLKNGSEQTAATIRDFFNLIDSIGCGNLPNVVDKAV